MNNQIQKIKHQEMTKNEPNIKANAFGDVAIKKETPVRAPHLLSWKSCV